jgi:hypothetical protein
MKNGFKMDFKWNQSEFNNAITGEEVTITKEEIAEKLCTKTFLSAVEEAIASKNEEVESGEIVEHVKFTTIAIIGTSGRNDEMKQINKDLYWKMVHEAERIIVEEWKLDLNAVHLISGGAALADQVSVDLFITKAQDFNIKLTLELPCAWKHGQMLDTGVRNWKTNPGGTCNYYHQLFSKAIGYNSLNQIDIAKNLGAELNCNHGFWDSMSTIAKAERIIAFTFNETPPKSGGTGETWRISKAPLKYKKHVCISNL